MFKKKHKITILNMKWDSIKTDISVEVVPRIYDLIYMEEYNKYFEVVRVIHTLTEKNKIALFVIVEDSAMQPKKVFIPLEQSPNS